MDTETFKGLRDKVIEAGYGDEIVWSESLKPCDNADDFFREYMWVVLSAGMKNQVVRIIEGRIYKAMEEGRSLSTAFGHKGKVKAIEYVLNHRTGIFGEYCRAGRTVEYLGKLPWVGEITKWHLAKNLGIDTAKPDRHLVRIAGRYGVSCLDMCRGLAEAVGYRISTVDLIIWRAANLGFV